MLKSLMFVPARMRMMEKLSRFQADAYVLDLEDSVPEADKDVALQEVCDFIARERTCVPLYVRVDRRFESVQVCALNRYAFAGYMIPKVESVADISVDIGEGKSVIALVETPRGIMNIEEIAATPRVDAIAFGAEDFTASIGMKNRRDLLAYPRGRILTCAKAYSKPVYDTPCLILDDVEVAEAEIQHSVDCGFDGKLSIHPTHTVMINRAFKDVDIESIRQIISEYEAAGGGAVKISGKVYEKMHISHLKRILKEHQEK